MKILSLYSESAVGKVDIFDYFFNIIDLRESRAGSDVITISVHLALAALSKGFDAAIGHISDETFHLVFSRGALSEVSKADTLHHSIHKESSSDH